MPLPAVGGLIGMGGGFSTPSSALSGATGGVQDTIQSAEFNFSSGGGSTSPGMLVGIAAAVAVAALIFALRPR